MFGLTLSTVEALLRTTTSVVRSFFAMPHDIGTCPRTHLAEHCSPLLSNRCKKSHKATSLTQNSYSLQSPSPDHCAYPRSDRSQMEMLLAHRSQRHASQVKRSSFACSAATIAFRPINSPGPNIRCNKTSPQQTDPPALS